MKCYLVEYTYAKKETTTCNPLINEIFVPEIIDYLESEDFIIEYIENKSESENFPVKVVRIRYSIYMETKNMDETDREEAMDVLEYYCAKLENTIKQGGNKE